MTNWNGEFRDCLDYVFISGFTTIKGSGKVVPCINTNTDEVSGSLDDSEEPLNVPFKGQVNSHWPSDHFLVKVGLELASAFYE